MSTSAVVATVVKPFCLLLCFLYRDPLIALSPTNAGIAPAAFHRPSLNKSDAPTSTRLQESPDRCTPAATATCAPADLYRHGEVAASSTPTTGPASSLGRRGVAVQAASASTGPPAGMTRRGAAAAATTTTATAASSGKARGAAGAGTILYPVQSFALNYATPRLKQSSVSAQDSLGHAAGPTLRIERADLMLLSTPDGMICVSFRLLRGRLRCVLCMSSFSFLKYHVTDVYSHGRCCQFGCDRSPCRSLARARELAFGWNRVLLFGYTLPYVGRRLIQPPP